MNLESPIDPLVSAGRFEVLPQKFDEAAVDGELLVLDLRAVLPDLFLKTERIPRALDRLWRRLLDDMLSEDRGIYCHRGGTQVQLYFYEVPPLAAQAKLDVVKARLPELLKKAESGKEDPDQPPEVKRKPAAPKPERRRGPTDLEKLTKGNGIGENPSLDLMDLWSARLFQSLTMSVARVPLLKEMVDLVARSDISYQPLWNASSQMIVGNAAGIKSAVPAQQYNGGELLRQDLALLFGALFQLYSMQSRGALSLMVVPLRWANFNNKPFSELYVALLRRLAPEVQKNLIIEFSDIPKQGVPRSLQNIIGAVSPSIRAYMFDTGFLTYADYTKGYPKLHACSCDVSEGYVKEEDACRLIKKYADHYSRLGIKTYIKSVGAPALLAASVEAELSYMSGPSILPAQKTGSDVKKLSLAQIVK